MQADKGNGSTRGRRTVTTSLPLSSKPPLTTLLVIVELDPANICALSAGMTVGLAEGRGTRGSSCSYVLLHLPAPVPGLCAAQSACLSRHFHGHLPRQVPPVPQGDPSNPTSPLVSLSWLTPPSRHLHQSVTDVQGKTLTLGDEGTLPNVSSLCPPFESREHLLLPYRQCMYPLESSLPCSN